MQNEKPKKTKLAPKAVIALLVIVFSVFLTYCVARTQNQSKSLTVGGHSLEIEVATSLQEKQRGLCCRNSLSQNRGLLFVYASPGDYRFWMKDTRIPLDMMWLDSAKKIVHIEHYVQPSSYPKTYSSPTPAQYILETNAGWSDINGIKVGDIAKF